MSRTNKDKIKYPKYKVSKHRANPYGLCRCRACTYGRRKGKGGLIEKAKHKFRTSWKTGKKLLKGIYTD